MKRPMAKIDLSWEDERTQAEFDRPTQPTGLGIPTVKLDELMAEASEEQACAADTARRPAISDAQVYAILTGRRPEEQLRAAVGPADVPPAPLSASMMKTRVMEARVLSPSDPPRQDLTENWPGQLPSAAPPASWESSRGAPSPSRTPWSLFGLLGVSAFCCGAILAFWSGWVRLGTATPRGGPLALSDPATNVEPANAAPAEQGDPPAAVSQSEPEGKKDSQELLRPLPSGGPTSVAPSNSIAPEEPRASAPIGLDPVASPPRTPTRPLLSYQSELTVFAESGLDVIVQGQFVGKTNEPLVVRCGARNVRLRRSTGEFEGEGLPYRLPCLKAVDIGHPASR